MRCPRCGNPLRKIDRGEPPDDPASLDDFLDEIAEEPDRSEHWECDNEACDLSSPCYFVVHHPYHGPNSTPGDSWSISWIK